jgi:ABC-type branched-subunit amino acid transport system permease subunit
VTGRRAQLLFSLAVTGLGLLLPIVIKTDYVLSIVFRVFLFAALGLAWNWVGGYCGQLSLGHAAYFGLGSYGLAIFTSRGVPAEPKLLLLDEPSLGLSPKIVEEVFQKIRQIGESAVTVLLVEQNVVDGLSVSRRGYVVEHGAVRMEGEAQELLANQEVRAAYLGL